MPTLYHEKVTSLPSPLTPNTVYWVRPAGFPNSLEIYVTDSAGSASAGTLTRSQAQSMIDAALVDSGNSTKMVSVANIAERDALDTSNAMQVFVQDASADSSVSGGWASYIWFDNTSSWTKMNEGESLDLVLSYEALTGRPAASAAQIDATVAASHTHANKTLLDGLATDGDGNLTVNGEPVRPVWETVAW